MIARYRYDETLVGFSLLTWVALFTWVTCTPSMAQQPSAPQTIEIPEAQVSLIQNTFIASPIAGVVKRVEVSEGATVDQDALLIQLDDERLRMELKAAVAAHKAATLKSNSDVDARYSRRAMEFHLRELEQSEQANSKFAGAVSNSEVEKLRLVVDQAELSIEQAQHEQQIAIAQTSETQAAVQIAEQRVQDHAIQASVGGQVVEITVQPGEPVEAGEPLVRIISLDPIRAECFIDGRRFGSELVGRKVQFICDELPGVGMESTRSVKFTGKVTFVSPELQPVTGQVRLWATIDNPTLRLRSGMRGKVIVQP
ncbi:putative efflux pump membrane fusion protein [Novipirellula galeiformis]|uniref:Putative efflux pump membrane fusion protein n=2 Tax=Novipirellula galeiformis TaxID=2528004 RepID=A0A5C6BRW1_9BACT|nr:putative efflux pump membrane fusion protein [Novipirellula galeiformis]